MIVALTDAEVETSRLERIAAQSGGLPDETVDKFRPGSFGYHEALHTASIAMNLLDSELVSHSAIINDPTAYRLAYRAFESAFALYQYLGAEHL